MDPHAVNPARQLAANNVIIDGITYRNHVVQLTAAGRLLAHYPLQGEQAMTLWHSGTIHIDTTRHTIRIE